MGWTATEIASGRDINMFDHLMTRLRDPTNPQDAATKAYVDTNAGGGGDFLPLAGGLLTGPLVMISSAGADAEIGITVGGRQAQIYWGNALVMRRGTANESVYIENNNGSNRSEVLTQLLGDARYLQTVAADAKFLPLTGGMMTGVLAFAANQGLVFGPDLSVIYELGALRLRKDRTDADPTIEDNSGINRSRIVTELIGDARYLQPAAADNDYVRKDFGVMTGALFCTAGIGTTPGLMIGDNQTGFLRPSGNMLQLLVGGPLVFTCTAGAALFPGAAISMNNQHITGLPTPLVPGDAAPKSYVDSQISGITAATAYRTVAFTPDDFTIYAPSRGDAIPRCQCHLARAVCATSSSPSSRCLPPMFRNGTMWELVYTLTDLTRRCELSVVAYKITNNDDRVFSLDGKIYAAVDASSGNIRVVVRVRCGVAPSGPLTSGRVSAAHWRPICARSSRCRIWGRA